MGSQVVGIQPVQPLYCGVKVRRWLTGEMVGPQAKKLVIYKMIKQITKYLEDKKNWLLIFEGSDMKKERLEKPSGIQLESV